MNSAEAIALAPEILKLARYRPPDKLRLDNFKEYAEFVAGAARELTSAQRAAIPWFGDWALAWRKTYDDFEAIRAADPMVMYRPKHEISYQFHKSTAFCRYFMAGNGTSKTQTGYAEHYLTATNQHPWRHVPPGAHSTFIVGLEYSKYAPNVFEKKFIHGEENNYLSPMFPEGGKWFNHYDDRKHVITLACTECAEAGKAQLCRHEKSTISLFSDTVGWEQLQGAQYLLGHFDEHVDEGWWEEGKQRLIRVPFGSMMVTATPLFGTEAWEIRKLKKISEGDPTHNTATRTGLGKTKYIEIFRVNQYQAGIVSPHEIEMATKDMTKFEIRARVYGEPAPMTKTPVFDLKILEDMEAKAREPTLYILSPAKEYKTLEDVINGDDLMKTVYARKEEDEWTGLRVWEEPQPNAQYIASVDTAKGVRDGDASCCSILKLENLDGKLYLSMVAQYHGWINPFDYGDEVFKAAVWYNSALVVVELTGGFGEAVVLRLKQLAYWAIYRQSLGHEKAEWGQDARFGVDTNASSKPFMVAALQQIVKDRLIDIPCKRTINEMVAFAQEEVGKDGARLMNPRFRGAGGAHDDRVMSLVIGASIAVAPSTYDYLYDLQQEEPDTSGRDLAEIIAEIDSGHDDHDYV